MKVQAYAFLNLTPSEFGKLTPREYQILIEGYKEREQAEMRKRAEQAMMYRYAMNAKKPTINKMVGTEKEEVDKEKMKREHEEAKKLMSADVIPIKRRKGDK